MTERKVKLTREDSNGNIIEERWVPYEEVEESNIDLDEKEWHTWDFR